MRMTRRAALQTFAATSVGIATGIGSYGVLYAPHHLRPVELDVPITGLPPAFEGLRVGLLTDIHHSDSVPAEDVSQAVKLVIEARPDLVVLGGDYVTQAERRYMNPVGELLAPLTSTRHGTFAVLGNHDDDREMPAALESRGVSVLKDARTQVEINGERLDIAGIRFWTRGISEIARVLRGTGGTTLLLAHDPRRLVEAASLDVQLVLSGHTHGGQVVLPGFGAPAARRFPVLAGLATRENTSLFVSRGVGTVYVPIRLNCPPDVSILTLRRRGT
ncbi:MAG: metallophosphoesterase [Vicinamibacterales bacterium]